MSIIRSLITLFRKKENLLAEKFRNEKSSLSKKTALTVYLKKKNKQKQNE